MDFLLAAGFCAAIVGIALLLGWVEKNVRSRRTSVVIWVSSLLLLLALWTTREHKWETFLLLLLIGLEILEHFPAWAYFTAALITICCVGWYLFNLLGVGIVELAQELEAMKARVAFLELSLKSEVEGISDRLDNDERSLGLPDSD